MKQYGKYERRPEGVAEKQPEAKNPLLQTYFTSLIGLVLCVTMFFGTTYAWFSSEVTNTGNEIHIGILDVELLKQVADGDDEDTEPDYVSLSETVENNGVISNKYNLFDNRVLWEPGYTVLETVKIVDKGNLAFHYDLTFTLGGENAELKAAAEWFDVWVYHDETNQIPVVGSYADITAQGSGWTNAGSLAQVLSGKSVFKGTMDSAAVLDKEAVHTYTIALHMNGEDVEDAKKAELNGLMGKKIGLNVKLVAYQMGSETDDFGNGDYDRQETVTDVTPENLSAIDYSANQKATYALSGSFTGNYTMELPAGAEITIDGSGATFSEGATLIIQAPQDADSYSNAQGKERVGTYTIQNFKGPVALSFVGYNTTVNITDNELGFLGLRLANVKANVVGNTIDAAGSSHTAWNNQSFKYGVYLNAADYDLVFTGNTVKNTTSHAVGINGRKADGNWPGNGNNADVVAKNSIVFTGNTISGYASGKAALKIWDDTYYAATAVSEESELYENAKTLIKHVLAAESDNKITVPTGGFVFEFYGYSLNALSN